MKFRAKNKKLFLYLLIWKRILIGSQEKLFVLQKGVPEYLVNGIMSLYKGYKTAKLMGKVGVHKEPALSPFLFIMVMDVLTEDVRDGSLMELLYTDDLVFCGESVNEVMDKYGG